MSLRDGAITVTEQAQQIAFLDLEAEHAQNLDFVRMLKRRLGSALILYAMSDDLPFFEREGRARQEVEAQQSELISLANAIVSVVPLYLEKYVQPGSKSTLVLPNGVSTEAMVRLPFSGSEWIRSLPRPRVGFVGAMTEALDWPVIERLVREHPDWSFLFAGTANSRAREEWSRLSRLRNVHHLGVVPYQSLGWVLETLDVGLIPFNPEDPTAAQLDDLKLKEYLAFGVPVVTLNNLSLFSNVAGITWKADDYSGFETAVREAAGLRDDSALVSRRKGSVMQEYDWLKLARKLDRFTEEIRTASTLQ